MTRLRLAGAAAALLAFFVACAVPVEAPREDQVRAVRAHEMECGRRGGFRFSYP